MVNLHSYLAKISKIHRAPRVDANEPFPMGGESPYKPALLLVVLEGISQEVSPFVEGRFTLQDCVPGLKFIFTALDVNGTLDPKKFDAMSAQPFWYLGAGKPKVFDLKACCGKADELSEATSSPIKQIKSQGTLSKLVECAIIPAADLELITQDVANMAIRGFLVNRFFPKYETHVYFGLKQLRAHWASQRVASRCRV